MRRLSESMGGMLNVGERRHDRLGSEEDMVDPRKKQKRLAELSFDVSKKPFRMSSGISIFKRTDTYVRIQSSYTKKPDLKSVVLKKISDIEILSKRIAGDSKNKIDLFFTEDLKGMPFHEQGYQVEAYLEYLSSLKSMDSRLILLEWLKLDEYKEPKVPTSPGSKENLYGSTGGYSTGSDSSPALDISDIDFDTAC